jgi:hypothetical protein
MAMAAVRPIASSLGKDGFHVTLHGVLADVKNLFYLLIVGVSINSILFDRPIEPVTSALANVGSILYRQERKPHGETGFGLVYPSLRILRKSTRSSSCSALSWRLPTWPFDSVAEVAWEGVTPRTF